MGSGKWATGPDDDRFGYGTCGGCGSEFKRSTPFHKWCSDECYQTAWRAKNLERVKERNRKRSKDKRHAEYQKGYLKRNYGLSIEEFDRMSKAQGNVCAICGGPPIKAHTRLSVDHVKGSQPPAVRGLLCTNCNMAIGMLQHNPAIAMAAASYLRRTVTPSRA